MSGVQLIYSMMESCYLDRCKRVTQLMNLQPHVIHYRCNKRATLDNVLIYLSQTIARVKHMGERNGGSSVPTLVQATMDPEPHYLVSQCSSIRIRPTQSMAIQ